MSHLIILSLMAVGLAAGGCGMSDREQRNRDDWSSARAVMIERDLRGRDVTNAAVLAAMEAVPRHLFVPVHERSFAYADHPLPIGEGQTISQPYIVAAMTELVQPKPGDVVLEIGTGSGYQAAVLAKIVKQVFTIEIVEPLARDAKERLAAMGYSNVTVRAGDGYLGWPEQAPFDGIVVTCGAEHVPQPLVDQLKPGGRMVTPVGAINEVQSLLLIQKDATGHVTSRDVMAVRFVPLTRPPRP